MNKARLSRFFGAKLTKPSVGTLKAADKMLQTEHEYLTFLRNKKKFFFMTQIQQTRVQVAKKEKYEQGDAPRGRGLGLPFLRRRPRIKGNRKRWKNRGKNTRIGRFMRNARARGLRMGRGFKRGPVGRFIGGAKNRITGAPGALKRGAGSLLGKAKGLLPKGGIKAPSMPKIPGGGALRGLGSKVKGGPKAGPLAILFAGLEFKSRKDEGQSTGQAVLGTGGSVAGGLAGAKGGAAAGAAIGALFGGVGAVPGAIIGGLLGGIGGSLAGGGLADAAYNFAQERREANSPDARLKAAGFQTQEEREAAIRRIQMANTGPQQITQGKQKNWFGFSAGGVVSSPTRALIGEGGEPEVVVPQSKLGSMFQNLIKQVGGMLGGVTRGFVMSLPTPDSALSGVKSSLAKIGNKFGGLGGFPVIKMFTGGTVPNLMVDIGNKIKGLVGGAINTVLGGPAYAGGMGISPQGYPTAGSSPIAVGGLTPGKWGPLLDLIAGKESGGNYEAMYPSTTLPGATKMTIAEVARVATGAVGKYQQLPRFLVGRAKAAGLNPDKDLYSPKNQDLIVTKVNIGQNRRGDKWLRGEISDEAFMDGLAYEFASLPDAYGRFKYPGQSSAMTPGKIRQALQKVKGGGYSQKEMQSSGNAHTNMEAAATSTAGQNVTGSGKTGSGKVSGFPITSYYGPRWGRLHGGVDVGTPVGTALSLAEDGEIVAAGKFGGYGYMIDAWLPGSKVQIRLAHLSQFAKRSGKFKARELLGKTGGAKGHPGAGSSTGPHLHFEADTSKGSSRYGGSGNPLPYASKIVLGSAQPANKKGEEGKGGIGAPLAPNRKPTGGAPQVVMVPMPVAQPVPVQVRVPVPVGAKKQPKLYGIDPFSGRYGAI